MKVSTGLKGGRQPVACCCGYCNEALDSITNQPTKKLTKGGDEFQANKCSLIRLAIPPYETHRTAHGDRILLMITDFPFWLRT
jgi:hypothetical protein